MNRRNFFLGTAACLIAASSGIMRAVEIPAGWNEAWDAEALKRAFLPRLRVQLYRESPILSYIRHLQENVCEGNSAIV